ncbi:MAG: DNA primase [Oscillospiraceae bacterium]|nr:DNA primase [Oscillospiraceae bacterium]
MPLFPEEFISRLRERNDIVDLFRMYADVKKRGRTYVCCCPFHSEKTPSCTIYPETQSFYCFGCGAGGDALTFVMRMDNLSYPEAVRSLAQRSGMELPQQDPRAQERADMRRRCLEINRETANFYYSFLLHGGDKRGLQYFARRKLTAQTLKLYGLGFSPDDWHVLRDHLRSKGYRDEEMVTAGVCLQSDKGNVYDAFRGRVMFPIVDLRGSVIGFGGRVLDDTKPKYLNTNATPVFDKGRNLFSLNFAKDAASTTMILAEGYMDVISIHQAGFPNVVATLGTAITPDQARLIAQYAREVVIAYDSDGAGQAATQKALNHFSAVGLPARILRMEGAKDPDEFLKRYGPEQFRLLIDHAGDALNFKLDKCREGLDLSTEIGKTELLRRSVNVLAGISNPLEREVYISRTAGALDIRVETLRMQVDRAVQFSQKTAKKAKFHAIEAQSLQRDELNPEASEHPRESRAEEMLLAYLLRHPEEYEMLWSYVSPEDFVTEFHRRVYETICTMLPDYTRFSLSLLAEKFSAAEMGRISGIEARYGDLAIDRDAVEECIGVLKKAKGRPHSGEGMSDEDLLAMLSEKQRQSQ